MDFTLSDEQRFIKETAKSFLAEVSSSSMVRKAMESPSFYLEDVWQRVASEMAFPALTIPQECGGLSLSMVELVLLLEEMGAALFCGPFFETAMATQALLLGETSAQKKKWLCAIAKEGLKVTLAYPMPHENARENRVFYEKKDGDTFLTGQVKKLAQGTQSDLILVAAQRKGGQEEALSLFAISKKDKGVMLESLPTMDTTKPLAKMNLHQVKVKPENLLFEQDKAHVPLSLWLNLHRLGIAAEALGGAQKTLDMTVSYTKERVQFGRQIASFQAVKHKAADMMVRVEAARSGVYYAALLAKKALSDGATEGMKEEFSFAAMTAKAYASDAFFQNAAEAIQLHGGAGFSFEYDVHLYFKRARRLKEEAGSVPYLREQMALWMLEKENV